MLGNFINLIKKHYEKNRPKNRKIIIYFKTVLCGSKKNKLKTKKLMKLVATYYKLFPNIYCIWVRRLNPHTIYFIWTQPEFGVKILLDLLFYRTKAFYDLLLYLTQVFIWLHSLSGLSRRTLDKTFIWLCTLSGFRPYLTQDWIYIKT